MNASPLYQLQAELCRTLGHPLRLELIDCLRDGPKKVNDLVEATGIAQSIVSRQLAVLRNSGILIAKPQGREKYYQVVDLRLTGLCDLTRVLLIDLAVRQKQAFEAETREMDEGKRKADF